MKVATMYEIVKEIEIDSLKREIPSDEISKKTSEYSKKFKEILNGLNIDPAYFKNAKPSNEYAIPEDARDAVKKLLVLYTSKPMKRVRKSQFEHLSFHEMKDIVECIKVLLCCTLQGKSLLIELNKLEVLTQYAVKEAYFHMQEDSLDGLVGDTKEMLTPSFERMLNHGDRIELMNYYNLEIYRLNKRVRNIIQLVNDIREEELTEISDHEYEQREKDEIDERFEIHEQIVKYFLKESKNKSKSIEYIEFIKEVGSFTGLDNEEKVLKELKELSQSGRGTTRFKLVTYEDADFEQYYRPPTEVVFEAIRKYDKKFRMK